LVPCQPTSRFARAAGSATGSALVPDAAPAPASSCVPARDRPDPPWRGEPRL